MDHTPTAPTCYRHPGRETYLSCSDCGKPICADCSIDTPVGQKCPDCAKSTRQGHHHHRPPAPGPQHLDPTGHDVPPGQLGGGLHPRSGQRRAQQHPVPRTSRSSRARSQTANGGGSCPPPFCIREPCTSSSTCRPSTCSVRASNGRWDLAPSPASTWPRLCWAASPTPPSIPGRRSAPRERCSDCSAPGWRRPGKAAIRQPGRAQLQSIGVILGINLLLPLAVPRIAWEAHVGGLVAGFLIAFLWTQVARDERTRSAIAFGVAAAALVLGILV